MFAFPINHTFTDLFREYEHLSFFPPYHSQNYKLKVLSIKLFINMESHPLRMRGLKLDQQIEEQKKISRILYGCVD